MLFKVEMVHTTKKYTSITVEADSEKEAIAKARLLKWEDFDEREAHAGTTWEAKDQRPWYEMLMSFLVGR